MENRWVKSTLSFREMPTFLEVENKLFVLSFENIAEKVEEVNEGKWRKNEQDGFDRVLNEAGLSNRISEASAAQEVGDDGVIADSRV